MNGDATPAGKKVLIVTASVGAGHNSAARALAEELGRSAPALRVSVVDSLSLMPRWFRAYYAGSFTLGMTRFPRVYGLVYRLTNHPQRAGRGLAERLRLAIELRCAGRFLRLVEEERPDLILHTHFLAPPLVHRLGLRGRPIAPQLVVVTDIEMHRFWYAEGVDHWFVPSEFTAAAPRRWDIPPERVTVSGIPIHPKWTQPLDRAKVRADWNLPPDRPIVLLTGGTEFVCAPVTEIAQAILDRSERAHVVVLAGRNKRLLEELGRMDAAGTRLTPLSFTDRANELAEVASVMLTKPGGITTAECLSKGTPMILLNPVEGQEGGNARWLVERGAGAVARTKEEAVALACGLLDDPARLEAMSQSARRLYRPGTQTVARYVRDRLGA